VPVVLGIEEIDSLESGTTRQAGVN
jgi:hypothetical protein